MTTFIVWLPPTLTKCWEKSHACVSMPVCGDVYMDVTSPVPNACGTSLNATVAGMAPISSAMREVIALYVRILTPLKSPTELTGVFV